MRDSCVETLEIRTLFSASLPGFVQSTFVMGLNRPTAMDFAPDGRLFVCTQGGALEVVKDGQLLATPFVTLPADDTGERGLLGVAFDPSFATNHFVYVYWTTHDPATHNKVSRFTASAANPDVAEPASETTIFDLPDLSTATNHNGGAIHFGTDGKLYIGVGENAQPSRSQDVGDLLGKLLRINPDGSVPSDNPFTSASSGRAVYATGLRNPFTFAVQPGSGRIFINDVGNGSFEEIDDAVAGANYGWPTTEGATNDPRFKTPLFTYPHNDADDSRAITGGTFYPTDPIQLPGGGAAPGNFPTSFAGDYFYSDLTGGYVKQVDLSTGSAGTVQKFATGLDSPVDLKIGPDGTMYVLSYNGAQVLRIASEATVDLSATIQTSAAGVIVGGDAGRANVTITNNGPQRVNGPVSLHLLLSTDGVVDSTDTQVLTLTKKLKLNAGASKLLKLKFKFPAVADGQYLLLAQVDPDNSIAETNEDNNVAVPADSFPVRFPGTDFSGVFVDPTPASLPRRGKGKVTLNLLNGGNIAAKGKLQVSLFAATDSSGAAIGATLTVLRKTIQIKPGAHKLIGLKFALPADLAAGTYFFSAALDSSSSFAELNEADNLVVSASSFTVG